MIAAEEKSTTHEMIDKVTDSGYLLDIGCAILAKNFP